MMKHSPDAEDIAQLVRWVPVQPLGTCVLGARFSSDGRRWVEAEVDDLDLRPSVGRTCYQYGMGRDIPVNKSRLPRSPEPRCDLEGEIKGFPRSEGTARPQQIR